MLNLSKVIGLLCFVTLSFVVNEKIAAAVSLTEQIDDIAQYHVQNSLRIGFVWMKQITHLCRTKPSINAERSVEYLAQWIGYLKPKLALLKLTIKDTEEKHDELCDELDNLEDVIQNAHLLNKINKKESILTRLESTTGMLYNLLRTFDLGEFRLKIYQDQVPLECLNYEDVQNAKKYLENYRYKSLIGSMRDLEDFEDLNAYGFLKDWAQLFELIVDIAFWVKSGPSSLRGLNSMQVDVLVDAMGYHLNEVINSVVKWGDDFTTVGTEAWIVSEPDNRWISEHVI